MNINEKKYGFTLLEQKYVEEVNSTARVFQHESGAELLHLENDDDNKVFTISFRTPPSDSKGIPHILEHSVLCGSRKFSSKEPFIELLKGSMNTFLNAMTFSDKTVYPVASTNEKDFVNLMDVYLDAVLYPRIYDHPEILMQEGWHHELDDKNDDIIYKGVVYNEMKGAFSSPEQVLFRSIQHSLFPDHIYGHESGGDPDQITKLSYKEFIDFHQRYYHPSNSKILIYGDGNYEDRLKFLHEKYLQEYRPEKIESDVPLVSSYDQKDRLELHYPVSAEENTDEKTYLSLNYVIGTAEDLELGLAFTMLDYILMESSAAPLRNALNESRLGKDVFGSYNTQLQQPLYSIVIKNSELLRMDAFQTLVNDTLKSIVNNGLDKKLIEAAINSTEFDLREADFGTYPKGLVYFMKVMGYWNYNDQPIKALEYEEALTNIKTALTTDYFEQLIQKYFLDNLHKNQLILSPKQNLAEENAKRERESLAQFKKSLSEDELQAIVNNTEKLKRLQATPDSQEVLDMLPSLELSDLKQEADVIPIEEKIENGIKVLSHDIHTSGLSYFKLFFDTTVIPQSDIQYLPLLTLLLGEVNTKNYSYSDLSNEINIHTGGIGFAVSNLTKHDDDSVYYPKLIVKGKSTRSKFSKMLELMGEMIQNTIFDDKDKIRELIMESKSRQEMSIAQAGHTVTMSRLFSYFSQSGMYNEQTSGLAFYQFISDIEKNFDERIDNLILKLKDIYEKVFHIDNLIVSITQSKEHYDEFIDDFKQFIPIINDEPQMKHIYHFDLSDINEGLLTPANIQYVSKGYNFRQSGAEYTGMMAVFSSVARLDYLWNRIRVQGGAYGAFSAISRNGNVFFGTYRDPNLQESLDAFDQVADYFESFKSDEKEMTKYIIGTVAKMDTPLTPSAKGNLAATRYIIGLTYDDIQKTRNEVLNTKPEHIREIAQMIGTVMKENRYCVLGNEKRIKTDESLFDELIQVFE